jgi:two-component system, OmpR family, alkaline phosphatase synthesis response regulator PhoP
LSSKGKILLVDDEKDILEFLSYNLKKEGYEVSSAVNGIDAMEKLTDNPDLIILDVMMPELDGLEVCRRIRKTPGFENKPVIFLTARGGEADEIKGLDSGADDYIQKPVSRQKLLARVSSNLRKTEKVTGGNIKITIGPLLIDREAYMVKVDGIDAVFTRKEFELLSYLALNPGKVFSRDALLKNIWGSEVYVVDRTVDVHIRKIREKLGHHFDLIETVKGVGYRFKSV